MSYKVIQWGTGAMGSGMVKMMLDKPGYFQVVGGIKRRAVQGDADLGESLGLGRIGAPVFNDPAAALALQADLVLHTTDSFTRTVYRELISIAESGKNCITIAEEMSYPWAKEPELAEQIHQAFEANRVTCLGTGINPGFILDLVIVLFSGAMIRVDRIEASRINDLSPFGTTVMRTQGVGTTPEEFHKGLKEGTIVGHIGFDESIRMIAGALGWTLDRVEQIREPIVSSVFRETPVVKVEPGMVAGCRHVGIGYVDGEPKIKLIHPQQIHPQLEGVNTGDYIRIEGDPGLNLSNVPEIPGGKGTIAVAVNMIPQVVRARPGLVTMLDLPVPTALMGSLSAGGR
ncbi:MAG: hypothetical protein JW797_00780 [Bradymonadales bacterium]|nr:hypothetical protein [Bradymonadales bacterium]